MSQPEPWVDAIEEPDPCASDPDALLAAAAQAMFRRGLARETRRIYLTWMRRLLTSSRRDPADVSTEALAGELGRLATIGRLGAPSLKQARAAARFLLRVVLSRPDDAPTLEVAIMPSALQPAIPTRKEVLGLLAACPNVRDRLLIGLAYGSGLRLGEALRLRAADLDIETCRVRVPSVTGHCGRETVLSPLLVDAAEAHLSGRMPWDWVFIRKDGHRLSMRGAQQAIERAAKRCGLGGRIHSRSLRRGFGQALAERGALVGTVSRPGSGPIPGGIMEAGKEAGVPGGIGSPL